MEPHGSQAVETTGRPVEQATAAMIMVHGRNAGPRNILDLVPYLAHPAFAYLAPAAAGNTWYPYSFMADTKLNEPGLSSGLFVLDRVVSDVMQRGIPRDKVMLLGFSQGACLAAEYAVRHAGRFGGVIIFSGGLIGPPGTPWHNNDGDFGGTPMFFGCSDVDPHVPKTRIDDSAEVFEAMGADVTKRIYSGMGHLVNEDEIEFARRMMDRVAG